VSAAPDTEAIRANLRRRYAEPHRRYHNLRHLGEVLDGVDELAGEAEDVEAVRWAAWYHDAVYEIGADDNEERSARLAEAELAWLPAVAEVARLVRLTATHKPAPGDRNGAVLCDADLRILGAGRGRYGEYVAAVRAEYAAVDDDAFARGRAAVLAALLDGPLFHTETARRLWEATARANVTAEIDVLRGRA
jgi:predicted metal-dependent HD superfamily phosphohydrolase